MKKTDTAKIRQLLNDRIAVAKVSADNENYLIMFSIKDAESILALLPCSTCNGTKEEIVETFIDHTSGNKIGVLGPCPDCQPKSCVCYEEITEENAHLHRNCGK